MDYKYYELGTDKGHFWFQARRELTRVLLNKIEAKSDAKILDIGSGIGDDISEINNFGHVYAMDIDQKTLDLIPEDLVVEKRIGDICNIPYEKNSFDIVISFDVLEHIKNDFKAVSEIKRVLKPGGSFVFTVPANRFIYSKHDEIEGHCRRYNKKMLKSLMLNNNLENLELGGWLCVMFPLAALYRILTKNRKNCGLYKPQSKILNFLFNRILSFENWVIKKGGKFPFGLSLYGICQKKSD
jgi:SAM-dependent methyltransferase